jgi:hypothetical protein
LRAQVPVPTPPPAQDTLKRRPKAPPVVERDSAFVRDSLLRVDSIRQALQAQAHADSMPDLFPAMPIDVAPASFAAGTWEWNEQALLKEGAITLGDLLRRIPGVNALRAGGYAQPEAVTTTGLTRGRIQVEVDGYVLDPMTSSTYDLAGIELINLTGVRVERRLDMIRIKLTTAAPVLPGPYTRLEVATGQPDINVFRAIFMVPKVVAGPLALAIDRVGAEGTGGSEPASTLGGWAKYSVSNEKRGFQLEYRRINLKREPSSPWLTNQSRQDITLRARSQLATGLTAELFGGHSTIREVVDTAKTATGEDSIPPLERGLWQYGARAAFSLKGAYANATARLRSGRDELPSSEFDIGGGFESKMIHIGGDVGLQGWKNAGTVTGGGNATSATTYDVRAQAGPLAGLSAFVEVASGDRGAPIYADSAGLDRTGTHDITNREAVRAGATFTRWGIDGGGAVMRIKALSSAPFFLPFDTGFSIAAVGEATGFEAWGRMGLFRDRLFLDASYTYYNKSAGWSYLPTRSWRIAGEGHLNPLPSGNFELFARIESVFRGPMLGYGTKVSGDSTFLQFADMPQNSVLNGYIQIRIIDVRAYIQWEDFMGKGRLDIPDRLIPGPRMWYGVKWQLFN